MRQNIYDTVTEYLVKEQTKFYRLAFSYVHNKEDSLDIVQNSICKALAHYEALKNEDAVKTWFYRILVNESIHFIKKNRREILTGEDIQLETPYYEMQYEPCEDLFLQINDLNPDTQTIIKLRFFEELSLKEISDITGLKENTVKTKLYRGLKMLKQTIQEVEV